MFALQRYKKTFFYVIKFILLHLVKGAFFS